MPWNSSDQLACKPLPGDPREELYISVEGHLEFASCNPLILTP